MNVRTLAFSGLLALSGLALAQDKKPPIVINDPEWPPYFFAGRPDHPPGLMK